MKKTLKLGFVRWPQTIFNIFPINISSWWNARYTMKISLPAIADVVGYRVQCGQFWLNKDMIVADQFLFFLIKKVSIRKIRAYINSKKIKNDESCFRFLEEYECLLKYTNIFLKFDVIPVSTFIFISFQKIKFRFILLLLISLNS